MEVDCPDLGMFYQTMILILCIFFVLLEVVEVLSMLSRYCLQVANYSPKRTPESTSMKSAMKTAPMKMKTGMKSMAMLKMKSMVMKKER